jgi:FkbM family methyltransferase
MSTRYLLKTVRYIKQLSNFVPKNIFEIGANFGQDAEFLRTQFNLKSKNIYVFEPHPVLYKKIKNNYSFNCYGLAVSDINKDVIFHAVDLKRNNGVSSLKVHKYNDEGIYTGIKVETIRMDYFISKNNIKSVDFVKIDVEGLTYEVLKGFGKEIKKVKALQIETEFAPIWKGQKTWETIYNLLKSKDFQLVDYELQEDGLQADSFWIQKEHVKHLSYNLGKNKWKKVYLS